MKGNFQEIIGGETPVLIDFHAEWCGPCKAQSPIIKEIAEALGDRVKVIKIDIDRNPGLAQRYQVRAVPTLALFQNGKMLWSQAGMMSKHQILSVIESQAGIAV